MLKDKKIGKQCHDDDYRNDDNHQKGGMKSADKHGRHDGGAGHDQGESAYGDEIAMGEVNQPENAEQQADAEGAQRVETAEAKGADNSLDNIIH